MQCYLKIARNYNVEKAEAMLRQVSNYKLQYLLCSPPVRIWIFMEYFNYPLVIGMEAC